MHVIYLAPLEIPLIFTPSKGSVTCMKWRISLQLVCFSPKIVFWKSHGYYKRSKFHCPSLDLSILNMGLGIVALPLVPAGRLDRGLMRSSLSFGWLPSFLTEAAKKGPRFAELMRHQPQLAPVVLIDIPGSSVRLGSMFNDPVGAYHHFPIEYIPSIPGRTASVTILTRRQDPAKGLTATLTVNVFDAHCNLHHTTSNP